MLTCQIVVFGFMVWLRYQQGISTTAWVGAIHSAMMDIGGMFIH